VFRSLLMLSAVGLGATLLLYSSVHSGDPQPAKMAFSSREAATALSSPTAATPTPAATPTASLTPIETAPELETTKSFALAPLAEVSLPVEHALPRTSTVSPRPTFVPPPKPVTIVRIEPDPVKTEDGNLSYSRARWNAKTQFAGAPLGD